MTLNVKVPKRLANKALLAAFGTGLFTLVYEGMPNEEPPCDDPVSVRIELSPKAKEYYTLLLPEFGYNKRLLARSALLALSKEPKHCLNCRL